MAATVQDVQCGTRKRLLDVLGMGQRRDVIAVAGYDQNGLLHGG
jgi:hypothetical protein